METESFDFKSNDSIPDIKCRPPQSEVRSFLFNVNYPSDMALHYLIKRNNKPIESQASDSVFFEIAKKNDEILLYPKSFDENWITNFVTSTMNCPKTESNISLLHNIYFQFFEVIISRKYSELNSNLPIFLNLTRNPNHPILELFHCRILCHILLKFPNLTFKPHNVRQISYFDSRFLNDKLDHLDTDSISLSMIKFAITYCIPSAKFDDIDYSQKRKVPLLYQTLPEPQFIFYHYKYFSNSIFDFCTFLLNSIHGFLQTEFEDENDDNFGITHKDQTIVNKLQLKVTSLLNLFLNVSVVTGSFLRVIYMLKSESDSHFDVLEKISNLLRPFPKIRLSSLLNIQNYLAFFELYSAYSNSTFNSIEGSFFSDIPFKKSNVFKSLSSYWCPSEFIIQSNIDLDKSLLLPNFMSMINRLRIVDKTYFESFNDFQIIYFAGVLSTIYEHNFSSKQSEIIFLQSLSGLFKLFRTIRPILIENSRLRHISVLCTFKSLDFIFQLPKYDQVTEYGLIQKNTYRIILQFIKENLDLFNGYVNSFNNITLFYQRATIIQFMKPNLKNMLLYYQIFLRSTTYQQFWIAQKFLKSLTYDDDDIGNLQRMNLELSDDPILLKNWMLFTIELIDSRKDFAKRFASNTGFNDFTDRLFQYLKKNVGEIGQSSLFLLHCLYKNHLIESSKKIEMDSFQLFRNQIQDIPDDLLFVFLDLLNMICQVHDLQTLPINLTESLYERLTTNQQFELFGFFSRYSSGFSFEKPDHLIQTTKPFSFMSLNNRPYRYLISPFYVDLIKQTSKKIQYSEIKINDPSYLQENAIQETSSELIKSQEEESPKPLINVKSDSESEFEQQQCNSDDDDEYKPNEEIYDERKKSISKSFESEYNHESEEEEKRIKLISKLRSSSKSIDQQNKTQKQTEPQSNIDSHTLIENNSEELIPNEIDQPEDEIPQIETEINQIYNQNEENDIETVAQDKDKIIYFQLDTKVPQSVAQMMSKYLFVRPDPQFTIFKISSDAEIDLNQEQQSNELVEYQETAKLNDDESQDNIQTENNETDEISTEIKNETNQETDSSEPLKSKNLIPFKTKVAGNATFNSSEIDVLSNPETPPNRNTTKPTIRPHEVSSQTKSIKVLFNKNRPKEEINRIRKENSPKPKLFPQPSKPSKPITFTSSSAHHQEEESHSQPQPLHQKRQKRIYKPIESRNQSNHPFETRFYPQSNEHRNNSNQQIQQQQRSPNHNRLPNRNNYTAYGEPFNQQYVYYDPQYNSESMIIGIPMNPMYNLQPTIGNNNSNMWNYRPKEHSKGWTNNYHQRNG